MRKRAPAWRSAIGRRIKVHDRHQFELKLEYQPVENERQARYVVEAYLCVPASLNISPDTVPREELYDDIHNYVRLMTPELSFAELGALPTSPLVLLTEELGSKRVVDVRRFSYHCRMLASIFRANLRDLADVAAHKLGRLHGGTKADVCDVADDVREAVAGAVSIAARFRELAKQAAALPDIGHAAYLMADELMSVSFEQRLRRVMVSAARADLKVEATPAAEELKKLILDQILAEERYRRQRGYTTILDPRTDNEKYLYRAGLLKKFCSSALFLEVRRSQSRRPWQELFFAIAAGIAMAFATVVAFWAQSRQGQLGFQLFAILVVGYMFKDRIKELTRGWFSRLLERGFYDRKIVLEDPAGGALGSLEEKIHYMRRDRVPAEVVEARRHGVDMTTRVALDALDERIIHYKKQIKLSVRQLAERGGGVTDIVRFHVLRWLHDMDEPDQEIEYFDEITHALGPVRAAKTYHVDVVFRFFARRGRAPKTTLMRLVLDRNGIKRIERVDSDGSGASAGVSLV